MIDFLQITGKIQFALYNGVVLSWREKVMSLAVLVTYCSATFLASNEENPTLSAVDVSL